MLSGELAGEGQGDAVGILTVDFVADAVLKLGELIELRVVDVVLELARG